MWNVALKVPVALVDVMPESGFVQLTGMLFPRAETVGWLVSLLHSSTAPVLLFANPEPLTDTAWPFVRLVFGVTVTLGAAAAGDAMRPIGTMSEIAPRIPSKAYRRLRPFMNLKVFPLRPAVRGQ